MTLTFLLCCHGFELSDQMPNLSISYRITLPDTMLCVRYTMESLCSKLSTKSENEHV